MAIDQKEEIIYSFLTNDRDRLVYKISEIRKHKRVYEELCRHQKTVPEYDIPGIEHDQVTVLVNMLIHLPDDYPRRAAWMAVLKLYDVELLKDVTGRTRKELSARESILKEHIILDLENTPQKREETLRFMAEFQGYSISSLDDTQKENLVIHTPQILAAGARLGRINLKNLCMELFEATGDLDFLADDEEWKNELDITDIRDTRIEDYLASNSQDLFTSGEGLEAFFRQVRRNIHKINGANISRKPQLREELFSLVVKQITRTDEGSDEYENMLDYLVGMGSEKNKPLLKGSINAVTFEFMGLEEQLRQSIRITDPKAPLSSDELTLAKTTLQHRRTDDLRDALFRRTGDSDFLVLRQKRDIPGLTK